MTCMGKEFHNLVESTDIYKLDSKEVVKSEVGKISSNLCYVGKKPIRAYIIVLYMPDLK